MSKVQETIRVPYPIEDVKQAIRSVALRTASPMTETGNVFTVKLKMKMSLLSSSVPASVLMELQQSKKLENATVIKFTSANLGIGPLQVRECQKKLDGVKEALLADLEVLKETKAELERNKTESEADSEKTGEKVVASENAVRKHKKIKTKSYSLMQK
jgi:ribosomal protein L30E